MNTATRLAPAPAKQTPPAAAKKTPSPASKPVRHCPKCGSARVHRSHRRGATEHALAIVGAQIRRCHDCRMRLAWFGSAALPLGRSEDRLHVGAQLAIVVAGTLVCLMFVWWVIQRSAANTG